MCKISVGQQSWKKVEAKLIQSHSPDEYKSQNAPLKTMSTQCRAGGVTSTTGACASQIREQMCLETHFQYEFSFLGSLRKSGLQRKKIQAAISMLLLGPVFYVFMCKKYICFI